MTFESVAFGADSGGIGEEEKEISGKQDGFSLRPMPLARSSILPDIPGSRYLATIVNLSGYDDAHAIEFRGSRVSYLSINRAPLMSFLDVDAPFLSPTFSH